MAKCTYGTGAFALVNIGKTFRQSKNGMLTTIAWKLGDEITAHAIEGSVFIAGAIVQWLRDGLGIIESSSDVEALARSVEDNGGVTCSSSGGTRRTSLATGSPRRYLWSDPR